MFRSLRQALKKGFDRISDDWNPITVRDLRRMWRSWLIQVATLIHLGSLAWIHVAYLRHPIKPDEYIVLQVLPTLMAMYAASLLTVERFVCARLADELVDTVPLTPKEYVHGILGTSCFLSVFFVVQALPFLAFPSVLPFPYSIFVRLGILFGGLIGAQIAMLLVLIFFIRTKTINEVAITFFVAVFLGWWAIIGPFLLMFGIVWNDVLHLPPLPEPNPAFMVLASVCGMLAVFSFVYLCCRLSLHHFGNRTEGCWRAVSANLLGLALWSFCWSGAAFVIALCFV